jgi:hypothetical protein
VFGGPNGQRNRIFVEWLVALLRCVSVERECGNIVGDLMFYMGRKGSVAARNELVRLRRDVSCGMFMGSLELRRHVDYGSSTFVATGSECL